ncbi:MAG TPA: condensation domain-containing protein, partial [Ktedonobacteraceae bacterium]|nr:condensation domain-containing protein [Ktedonobacteraceae bacterium]
RYWTHQLSEARALELPTDYPRSHDLSNRGSRYDFSLNASLTRALGQLNRQEGVTMFMTLLAGFQVLLYRLSGEQDIVVGTDSANRTHLETEGLIGFFINMLVLRSQLSGKQSFLEVLQQVREMVLGAYMHQELPFEMVVEHLRLQRESNRTPLVNVLFVMQNVPSTHVELPDLLISSFEDKTTSAKFDLALFVTEDSTGLHCSVNYRTDLFKDETIATLMRRYEALLHSSITQPDMQIASLELTTAAEKDRGQVTLLKTLRVRRGRHLQISEKNGHQPDE